LWLRISANWATAIWGLLSVANSYLIYVALVQGWWLLSAAVVAVYYLALVIDCVDGEIARARGTASPIGGKLLDGIWHKATEYSLLVAYAFGATGSRWGSWALPIGLALMAGEAMHTYAYERRLLVIRVHAQSKESISGVSSDDVYRREERWSDFSAKRKMNALRGLIQYKSAYFMVALAAVSHDALFAGVAVLTIYKHYDWIALITNTVVHPPRLRSH
jgi:phosphatidylglycerophosphate synthase